MRAAKLGVGSFDKTYGARSICGRGDAGQNSWLLCMVGSVNLAAFSLGLNPSLLFKSDTPWCSQLTAACVSRLDCADSD